MKRFNITNIISSISNFWWLETKNTFKDEGIIIFFIIVPLIYPLLYSWIYSNEVVRNVLIVVVDQSNSHASRHFINKLDASPDVKVEFKCSNIEEAKELLAKQDAKGIIFFPNDFQKKLYRGEQSHISIFCDMSLMLTYKAIYTTTMYVSLEINKEIQKQKLPALTKEQENVSTEPISVEAKPIFNTTIGYGNALIPGVLILIIQQTLLLGIGLAAGTAKENNTYENIDTTNGLHIKTFELLVGKSLCYFLIYIVMTSYVLLCVPRFFNFTMIAHPDDLIAFITPYLLSVIFFSITISIAVKHRESIMLLTVFTSLPLLFLSGASWPEASIPTIWKYISWIFPSTFGIRGFQRLASMGGNINDVKIEHYALLAQAIVYFIIAYTVHYYQLYKIKKQS